MRANFFCNDIEIHTAYDRPVPSVGDKIKVRLNCADEWYIVRSRLFDYTNDTVKFRVEKIKENWV
jgi:hypothetical protein